MSEKFLLKVSLGAFLYTCLVALFIQFIALPFLFPAMNGGEGLIVNTDAVTLNRRAKEIAHAIEDSGWKNWQLKPDRAGIPVGVASALYVIFAEKPWVLIPLNALLQAATVLILILILERITKSRDASVAGGIFFLLLPTPLNWYAQIHRDGYYILGVFLVLYGWLRAVDIVTSLRPWRSALLSWLFVLMGDFLIWLARDFSIAVITGFLILVAVLQFIVLLKGRLSGKGGENRLFAFALFSILSLMLVFFMRGKPENYSHRIGGTAIPIEIVDRWTPTPHIPKSIDSALAKISSRRNDFRQFYEPNRSYIDNDVEFTKAEEVLSYLPRALEIAFLAPFPSMWLKRDSNGHLSVLRLFSGIEMLLFYFALLGLVLNLPKLWRELGFWVVLIPSFGMILMPTLIVTNLGALYRYRFGFLALLTAIGIASWWQRLSALRRNS